MEHACIGTQDKPHDNNDDGGDGGGGGAVVVGERNIAMSVSVSPSVRLSVFSVRSRILKTHD